VLRLVDGHLASFNGILQYLGRLFSYNKYLFDDRKHFLERFKIRHGHDTHDIIVGRQMIHDITVFYPIHH
jgi:hypothetical protein